MLQFPFLLAIGIARVSSTLAVYAVAPHRERGFSKIVMVHRGTIRKLCFSQIRSRNQPESLSFVNE
jgi:hypothetical protein